jgi:tetratricopeptide (TPR) repeat protein
MRGSIQRQKGELDNAIKDFNECIRLNPKWADGFMARGNTWADKQQYEAAMRDFDEAIRLKPDDALAYFNRGLTFGQMKENDKAIADFSAAIRLDPHFEIAYSNRAVAHRRNKAYDKAINDFGEAIRLDPKSRHALNGLAWLLATCPDPMYRNGKRAVSLATKACELSEWKTPTAIGTLSAAYAETGDFERAIRYQKQALSFPVYEMEYGEGARQRLKLYESRQAYRD